MMEAEGIRTAMQGMTCSLVRCRVRGFDPGRESPSEDLRKAELCMSSLIIWVGAWGILNGLLLFLVFSVASFAAMPVTGNFGLCDIIELVLRSDHSCEPENHQRFPSPHRSGNTYTTFTITVKTIKNAANPMLASFFKTTMYARKTVWVRTRPWQQGSIIETAECTRCLTIHRVSDHPYQ